MRALGTWFFARLHATAGIIFLSAMSAGMLNHAGTMRRGVEPAYMPCGDQQERIAPAGEKLRGWTKRYPSQQCIQPLQCGIADSNGDLHLNTNPCVARFCPVGYFSLFSHPLTSHLLPVHVLHPR